MLKAIAFFDMGGVVFYENTRWRSMFMASLPNYRQELFARGLANGMTAAAAYKNAGYSDNDATAPAGASRLGQNPAIQARVAEIMADQARSLMIDKNYVLGKLIDNIERCMVPTKKVVHQDGTEETLTYNPAAANKAIELLGKELGMFIDKKEVGAPGEFSAIDNAGDLRELIARRLGMAERSDGEARVSGKSGSGGSGPH